MIQRLLDDAVAIELGTPVVVVDLDRPQASSHATDGVVDRWRVDARGRNG